MKRIKKYLLCFMLALTIAFSSTGGTAVVYASDIALPMPTDTTTWKEFLEQVALKLGVSVSSLTPSMIQPYLVAIVGVGACAYLGYDLYTNFDEISHSADADSWFEQYSEIILSNSVALEQGVSVPINVFQEMTACMSSILTVDAVGTFAHTVSRLTYGGSTIAQEDIYNWIVSLGYTGGYAVPYTYQINNPVMCVYNQSLQDYRFYRYDLGTKSGTDDLLIGQVGNDLIVGNLYDYVTNEMPGYGFTENYSFTFNQTVSTKSDGSWTSGYSGTINTLPDAVISRNGITCVLGGTTYNVAFLLPQDDCIMLGNIAYSDLVFPLTVAVHNNTVYPDYVNNVAVLPYYYAVQILDGESLIDANAKAVDRVITDADVEDDAIVLYPDIPMVGDWVHGITGELDISDAVATTPDGNDNNDGNNDSNVKLPTLPWVDSSDFVMPSGIHNALLFIKECFSRIWSKFVANDVEAVLVVPISLAVIGIIVGRGFSKRRGG